MKKTESKNFFIGSSIVEDLAQAECRALTLEAERGLILRRWDKVLTSALAMSQYSGGGVARDAALFYAGRSLLSLPDKREWGRRMLEQVAHDARAPYRAKALLALGNLACSEKNFYRAQQLYHSAEANAVDNPLLIFLARRNLATTYSLEGSSLAAMEALLELEPLSEIAGQQVYRYEYWNSLAVVFGEIGERDYAQRLALWCASSPYGKFYPEFRGTLQDLRENTPGKPQVSVRLPRRGRVRRKADDTDPERRKHKARILNVALDEYLTTDEARAYADAGEATLIQRYGWCP